MKIGESSYLLERENIGPETGALSFIAFDAAIVVDFNQSRLAFAVLEP